MPYIISEVNGEDLISFEEMLKLKEVLENQEVKGTFLLNMDIPQFQKCFATILAKLETANEECKTEHIQHIDEATAALVHPPHAATEETESGASRKAFVTQLLRSAVGFAAGIALASLFRQF